MSKFQDKLRKSLNNLKLQDKNGHSLKMFNLLKPQI